MKDIKIKIIFAIVEKASGGGNQFLKTLREYLINKGIYTEDNEEADCFLFNSHHSIREIFRLKQRYPNKIFIHRVDGPVFLIRNKDLYLDKIIFKINNMLADGTIFQSQWSKEKCIELGYCEKNPSIVIYNATSELYKEGEKNRSCGRKINLISTSWSSNIRKGFDIYKYIDENLDFNKYNYTFVGNSPYKFKNIRILPPQYGGDLVSYLKKADIYITASMNDPCSNALIEALNCGLPAVIRDDGGHPELADKAGEAFKDEEDVLLAINKVSLRYDDYQKKITKRYINGTGLEYIRFINFIFHQQTNNKYYSLKERVAMMAGLILIESSFFIHKVMDKIYFMLKAVKQSKKG